MSSEKYEVDLVDFSNSDVKPSNSSSNFTQKPTTAVENGCRPDNHESESTNLEPPISEQLLLNLNVCQARLVKNHGFFPMRLYCRVLIGDAIFETHTESGAGKHPIWNKTFQCWLHDGVDRLKVEVVSENIIFSNSQVAHAVIIFPRCLLNGIAVDQWFDLSGNQGESSAGSINLIFQCQRVPVNLPVLNSSPLYFQPRSNGIDGMRLLPKPISTEDIESIHEIFPSVEDDTIRSLLTTHHGNRERVISELLRMTSET